MEPKRNDDILRAVRNRYSEVAKGREGGRCCTSASCCTEKVQETSLGEAQDSGLFSYREREISSVPNEAQMGLGCGNPLAIASIKPGETVLDLGSGGGIDCFLASEKVGEAGHVIGVDMTPDMLSKARSNAAKYGYRNVEFRLGEIENLPVADGSVDIIISNCVINLSPDKARVFSEAFRVLKPGGRLAIADMVATAPLPDEIKKDVALYVGCIAGALVVGELKSMLGHAGFVGISVRLKKERVGGCAEGTGLEGFVTSAMIEATKPG